MSAYSKGGHFPPGAARVVKLYSPVPPHRPVFIRPGVLRRLGLRRSPFATMNELSSCSRRPKP